MTRDDLTIKTGEFELYIEKDSQTSFFVSVADHTDIANISLSYLQALLVYRYLKEALDQ